LSLIFKETKINLSAMGALIFMGFLFIPVALYNRPLFIFLNGLHTPLTDRIWLGFTTLGDGFLLAVMLGVFLIINPRITVFGLLLLACSSGLAHAIKYLIPLARPVVLIDSVHLLGPILRSGSFPSGHAAAAMAASLALVKFTPSRGLAIVAILWGVLVSLSRVFVGAHFPMDVLGGAMCATVAFIALDAFVWPALERRIPATPALSSNPFRAALFVEIAAGLCVVTLYPPYYSELPSLGIFVGLSVLVLLAVFCRRAAADRSYWSSRN
jgi:undecaprenyl-diphosphatase